MMVREIEQSRSPPGLVGARAARMRAETLHIDQEGGVQSQKPSQENILGAAREWTAQFLAPLDGGYSTLRRITETHQVLTFT